LTDVSEKKWDIQRCRESTCAARAKKRQGERERSPCHGGRALWRYAAAKIPIFIGSI